MTRVAGEVGEDGIDAVVQPYPALLDELSEEQRRGGFGDRGDVAAIVARQRAAVAVTAKGFVRDHHAVTRDEGDETLA